MGVVDDLIEQQVEQLDSAIEELNTRMAKYDSLKEKRDRLVNARRALIGGPGRGAGGAREGQVPGEEIEKFLTEHPGSTPSEIAAHFDVKQPTISSALYRGKNERYLSRGGKWWVKADAEGE